MEDIRELEEETKRELDEERAKVEGSTRLQCSHLINHILGGTERHGCPGRLAQIKTYRSFLNVISSEFTTVAELRCNIHNVYHEDSSLKLPAVIKRNL